MSHAFWWVTALNIIKGLSVLLCLAEGIQAKNISDALCNLRMYYHFIKQVFMEYPLQISTIFQALCYRPRYNKKEDTVSALQGD